jgi:acetylornithine deacetylase/succinyl-diaminopimelate desuccinylase-like protein
MRDLQRRKDKALPIDVYFMLVGDRDGTLCYQRFNPQYLRESIVGSIGHGTHLMVVESTGLRACIVQKGCIVFRLTISGRSHHPSFPWLGENPWEVLIKFEERLADTMKPKHDIYPVEVGKAPPMMLSNFLIGYPIMTPLRLEYHQPYAFGERSSIETEYYVSTPPEISHKEIEEKFSSSAKEIAKRIGCEATVTVAYREEPFRGDAKSAIVRATSSTFQKLTGFEPVFEWLPYPVSAKDLTSSGFAKDVMVLGPGDWAFSTSQDEKSIITEAMRASEILAQIPFEVALLEEKRQAK